MNILIVDDHAIVRAGLRRLLRGLFDGQVLEAATGREALALARSRPLDLVLLDMNLPELGGLELLSRLATVTPSLPVLVLSMHAEPLYVSRAIDAGARGYVSKNIAPEELVSAIKQVASGGRYVEGGADRISQVSYNAAGQPTKIEKGVGTPDITAERTLSYTNNGKLSTLKDGKNNLTTYSYDGFDRLVKTQFPNSTQGSGTSSTTDYEQLSYDASSNVTSRRLRDGTGIGFTIDNLDRVTAKDLPGSEPDVSYSYDNLGRLTSVSQTGNALSFTFDALSRLTNETGPEGTTHSDYNLDGTRSQITYSGTGLSVNYDYLTTGDILKIRENNATTGVGVLATYAYDNLGNSTSLTYGNGVVQSYALDGVSRLTTLSTDLAGTANDLTIGGLSTPITYNAASQITSAPRSNGAYSFSAYVGLSRSYTTNGLNQHLTAGPASFTYDTKGNLTSDGTNSYCYSSENLLTASGGTCSAPSVALSYDPLLRLYQVAGSTTTRLAYDGPNIIADYDGTDTLQHRYVFAPGIDQPIVEYSGSGTSNRTFLSADERGSIIARTDSSGALVTPNTYDEYGIPGSTNAGLFQYTGQAWLNQLGMYYYKARIYSPTLGRFLQTDPIGYGDSPNLYEYAGADPVDSSDPSGLMSDINRAPQAAIYVFGSDPGLAMLSNAAGFAMLGSSIIGSLANVSPESEIIIRGRRLHQRHAAHPVGTTSYGVFACDLAPLSPADKKLVDQAMSDPNVHAAMVDAWSKTVKTGNEQSFFVYSNSNGGFSVGHIYTGTSTMTDPRQAQEYQFGSGQPILNYHTHPQAGTRYADNRDADFNINTGSIGIISTPLATVAGRQCQ